ncbi:MAG: transcriptional repressor LexA [Chromatiales bacterium]|nr:transcriptional repressor LexA [Chromatiales bacterium]
MLTAQQNRVLQVIREHLTEHGHAPTLEEIGLLVGVRSRGAVHRLVQALIDKGYLARTSSGWRGLALAEERDALVLPLLGRIAAGRPIEAIPGEEQINLSEFLLGPGRYALRVQGDSMIGAGILDGDTVVVRQADTARDGEIVVALIDGESATLKRLQRRKDGMVALLAENPDIPTQIYPAERVLIQGVVVAQLRSYP